MMALVKPARSPSLPVLNENLGLLAYLRAYVYARAASRSAPACVLMCKPSATSAIDPNRKPPTISASIIAPQSQITAHVLRSLFSCPSPRNTWLCKAGAAPLLLSIIARLISDRCGPHRAVARRPRRSAHWDASRHRRDACARDPRRPRPSDRP